MFGLHGDLLDGSRELLNRTRLLRGALRKHHAGFGPLFRARRYLGRRDVDVVEYAVEGTYRTVEGILDLVVLAFVVSGHLDSKVPCGHFLEYFGAFYDRLGHRFERLVHAVDDLPVRAFELVRVAAHVQRAV